MISHGLFQWLLKSSLLQFLNGIALLIVATPLVLVYLPIRAIAYIIAKIVLIILWPFKLDKETNRIVRFLTFFTVSHHYKGKIKFFKWVDEKILSDRLKLGLSTFLLAIPLIFVYVPIRWLVRFIAKILLFIVQSRIVKFFLRKIKVDPDNNMVSRFFRAVIEPHPYRGHDPLISSLENKVTGEKVKAQGNRNFIFFLVPALGSFLLFVITPFLMGIYYSFTDWTGLNSGQETIIGFANYSTIFNDYLFIYSFIRTTMYSVLNVLVINVVAFSLALLVTQNLKFKNVYRAGFFMPNLIGGLVLGYIWQFIYSSVVPLIGDFLNSDSVLFTHSLIGGRATAGEAMGAMIIVVTWQYAGYIMMIYIAALQNVPMDLIEASKIDGANGWQRLRTIIFPLVAQAFTISLFLTLVTSFKQYDTVYALSQGGPSTLIPEWLANLLNVPTYRSVNALDLMAMNIYDTA
ncbi:MAG TPA: sugar ABC transporter permease, partial [Bacillota bacterium]|nr:sugar ABC transporter permease [Bacillota bacterium]